MAKLSRENLVQHALRAKDSRAWLESRRADYSYWATPTPIGSPRPETVEKEITREATSAVLAPGMRTYAFRHRADRDKFERRYAEPRVQK